jgi:signal transduction histidine kinase
VISLPPSTLSLSPERSEYEIWEHLALMEDPSGTMTIDDVAGIQAQSRFIPASSKNFASTFRSSVYWGRFAITDTSSRKAAWVLTSKNFSAGRVDVFVEYDSAGISRFHHFVSGNTIAPENKNIPWYGAAFNIPLRNNTPSVVYVRIQSNYFFFDFKLSRASHFIWSLIREHLAYGVFYGAMLMLIVYNIALFIGFRERVFVLCVLYASFAVVCTLTQDGIIYEVLPFSVSQSRVWIVHCAFGGLMAILAFFAAEFLHTKKNSPPIHQLLLFIAGANMFRIFLTPLFSPTLASLLLNVFDSISAGVVMVLALWRWRSLGATDKVFALATSFFVVCLLAYLLNVLGIFEENTFVRRYILHIGIVVQTGFFSLVAGTKVGDLRHQKINAEAEAAKAELYRLRNVELAEANAEITRQQDLVMEQSREIEITNTQLQEQNVKLERLNAQKNDFLGMAAHDLKNPLTSIRDLAQALESGSLSPRDAQEFSGLIHTSANRMFALIKDLLDTNAIEQGGMKVVPELFDMNILVQNVCTTHRRHADSKSITFEFSQDPPEQAIFCFADPSLTLQVIDNLISNAVKYSPMEKRVLVKVVRQPVRFVRVEIQDEGEGLSEEDQQKLFGRFVKLSARPTAGEHSTGLGLSIAKNLVEMMNGRIWCESKQGSGATFILELPSRAV